MRNKKWLALAILSMIAWNTYSWIGCGKNASSSGTATLKFSNKNNSPLGWSSFIEQMIFGKLAYAASSATATAFQMKLIAAYLAVDIDPKTQNNVGGTATFYVNPLCSGDLMHCDISAGTAEDGAPYKYLITNYFDFGQDSATVNAALNAQSNTIDAASYKYVRVEFCKVNQGNKPNIIWAGGSSGGNVTFQRNTCTVNSAVMNPPLVVSNGDSVTIKLAYDYSNSIQTGSDATGDSCTGSGSSQTCFTLPQFVPSASKN